jgi:antibiotic biosynthesis monooxygenase (ABM) superfamily enzyme
MKRCVEVLVYRVKQGKVDDLVAINKVRYEVMKKVPGCRHVLLIRLPFGDNVYARIVIWESKDTAMRYCGERLQRDRFLDFLKDNVEDMAILFLDEIDLSDMSDVPEEIKNRYFVPRRQND